uniref:CRM domain-containing protein n=1 Tax=Nelumbo nucifera TaxID=4432 RepID=A0A822YLY3_NELNU|nr:TPA_asm: hypothetical protein HUJ06_011442 [Nelumbo nucifera]
MSSLSVALCLSPFPPSNTSHFSNNPSPSSTHPNISALNFVSSYHINPKLNDSFKSLRVLSSETHTPSIDSSTSSSSRNNNSSNSSQSPSSNFAFLSEPPSRKDDATIKMPTAPWMKGPILLPANEVLDLSKTRTRKKSSSKSRDDDGNNDKWLTDRVSGGRGKQAMRKIMQGITRLRQETHNCNSEVESHKFAEEELAFRVPLGPVGSEDEEESKSGGKMPWSKAERLVFPRMKKEKVATAAELTLPGEVLKRLRSDAAKMRKWVKVKKAGVTQAVVDEIKMIWRNNELAMINFDIPLCRNMDRAREIVEIKTGGLVVWSKKDTHVVYRGSNYLSSSEASQESHSGVEYAEQGWPFKSISVEENMGLKSINRTLYEREADRLLDGLGPRFIDWWRQKPLPVDADLLPEVVPDFRPPFRLCPPNVRSKLTDDELTYLRSLARHLPTHFALEILLVQHLTGGVLILRNKFLIILYRGKDFLPCGVANLIVEREMELSRFQLQEEGARFKAIESFHILDETLTSTSAIGTFSEFQDIQKKCIWNDNKSRDIDIKTAAEKEKLEKELRKQERMLFILKMKIKKSAKELAKLNLAWKHSEHVADREIITEEERECFRKIGLKMDKFLVLGRRGVFDGVIEGLHQHWKHREIVKVITMQRSFIQVMDTAKLLEIESGGILVSVEKLKKGHAIILYRGKNYRRPLKLVPDNFLTKREALQRSLEMQRIGSLKFFAYQRQQMILNLKHKLMDLQRRSEEAQTGLQDSQKLE